MQPVLSVQNLSVSLPPRADRPHAVRTVGFEVAAGQTVCLVGESGSGKSVIANAVMGLLAPGLAPTEGHVRLLGEDVLPLPPRRLRQLRGAAMAMVFQEPMTALNPVQRCGHQVDEMLRTHTSLGARERRCRVLQIFGQVHLPDPERIYLSYPHQLSGGQRQRIVIAMALILRPALLICDEPTTALDVSTQAEILTLIAEMQRINGTAVLFITHDFGVVAEIADWVVVLESGRIVEQGAKLEVLQKARAPYTRMLLAAVPRLGHSQRPPLAPSAALLDARAIGKTYASGSWPGSRRIVRAAHDVSLAIHPGETVGIVGESGSGKSTVARCIARLIEPTSGDIILEGRSLARAHGRALSPLRRRVQVVFQDPYRSLNPRRTAGASIIEGPLNFGVPREQAWARAEELMRLVGLRPEALHRYPSQFSGGQRQRVSIARALACDPRVLIADEAVSALDVSVQAQILDLLNEIQRRFAVGILFITHDLRVASQICDRVIIMQQGRIVEQGRMHDVFFSPQHTYTRALLDAAPARDFAFGSADSGEPVPRPFASGQS